MDSIVLIFTGDIAFDRYFSLPVCEPLLDQPIVDFLAASDFCVGNMEGPFFRGKSEEGSQFRHHSDGSVALLLRKNGVNIWNLANNHALDFGCEGIRSSVDLAKSLGCRTMGIQIGKEKASAPIILPDGGGVGLFSVTFSAKKMQGITGCSYLDWNNMDGIREIVAKIKKECRWCVMIVHGGEEFSDLPMPETRSKYFDYLHTGVDVIVGHHPHVVQNYETVGDKIIFYSLGNFIFDTDYQRNQIHTDVGELVRIKFDSKAFEWTNLTVRIDRENCRVIQEEKDPIVFVDLQGKDYKKLWRCAAKGYYMAERRARLFINPEKYRHYSSLRWVIRDLAMIRAKKKLSRIAGRYLAWITCANCEDENLVAYLTHK